MPPEPAAEPLLIRALAPHEGPIYRAVRLRALEDSPDAFCSTLADEQRRSPASWAARLAAAGLSGTDYPLIAECNGRALGMLWAKVDAASPSVVNLFQVWVAPESRGRGVAAGLLTAAIEWAKSKHARVVQLSVTCGDTPAKRLYVRAGFIEVGAPALRGPGSPLREQAMRLAIDDAWAELPAHPTDAR